MSQIDRLEAPAAVAPMTEAKPLLRGWWRLVDMRIGIIPLPLFPLILALMAGFVWLGKLPPDLTMMIPLIALGAYICAEIGRNIPILRNVGGAAIIATFLPSYLVYAHLLPAQVIKSVTDFAKQSNFLYLFICCIIVGSILGMQRDVLIKGFLKVFVPLITGSIAAAIVGTAVGWALGLGAIHTLFYIVVPIMGGGVGEGALPLSLGYATVTNQPQGVIFATILPAVMLGSLTAIIFSGALNYLGKRYPHLTGEGRLQPSEHGDALANAEVAEEERPTNQPITAATVAAAGLTAITLYLVGMMVQDLTGFPAPVLMLFTAVALKLLRAISATLREGAGVVYRFFAQVVTYPLLFAIGIALTPWDALVATLRPEILITIVSTVGTIMGTGFIVGRWVNLYPIESAIVNACHSGQGGTGDVAILTAANRMELMPFAQIATRIGGAITVTIAISAVAWFI
jgi:CCS family citrate carrier protein